MKNAVPIHEAKTNLSKLVKQAAAGKTFYIGAYGQPQAIITAVPKKQPIKIGVLKRKYIPNAYNFDSLVSSSPEISQDFEDSLSRSLPV